MIVGHIRLMAEYNQWMNRKVYETAGKLNAEQLAENRGAFFGSVLGTLNHLMVADTLWLQRMARAMPDHAELDPIRQLSTPTSLDQTLFTELPPLAARRALIDDTILAFAHALSANELAGTLSYKSIKGLPSTRGLHGVLTHFFNHQTHHRGQTTTLLSQFGLDVGITDLLMLVPEIKEGTAQ